MFAIPIRRGATGVQHRYPAGLAPARAGPLGRSICRV